MDETLTLAFVVAHPDDDAYGIAGTVALHADDPRLPVRAGARDRRGARRHP